MGRKKTASSSLGKRIIKSRFNDQHRSKDSFLHTSELDDGQDWSSLNMASITEQSDLESFLASAQQAGRQFNAERLETVKYVHPGAYTGVLEPGEEAEVRRRQADMQHLLSIPRRPAWQGLGKAELDRREREGFVDWRRGLSKLEEEEGMLMTPYEKNLEFWRQLWRVVERSDVVVQIVDARHPLLFWCRDVERYVKEVGPAKRAIVLVNKADLLTQNQREQWAEYFGRQGVTASFWSALAESERLDDEEEGEGDEESQDADDKTLDAETPETIDEPNFPSNARDNKFSALAEDDSGSPDTLDNSVPVDDEANISPREGGSSPDQESLTGARDEALVEDRLQRVTLEDAETASSSTSAGSVAVTDTSADCACAKSAPTGTDDSKNVRFKEPADRRTDEDSTIGTVTGADEVKEKDTERSNEGGASGGAVANNPQLLSGEELIQFFLTFAPSGGGHLTVGMVGYPNVGKSSTVNALLGQKKTAVSETPGRTKHFQTLHVLPGVLELCDCPGLVMPSFATTRAHMVLHGILPVHQMRDHLGPVNLVCQRVSRGTLEALYGINIARPAEGEDQNRSPTAHELLAAYASMRGLMTSHGQPDEPRAARYIVKDFLNGKLLYCEVPPDVSADVFQPTAGQTIHGTPLSLLVPKQETRPKRSTFDDQFFAEKRVAGFGPQGGAPKKEGASHKRHFNKNKREKLRRLHKDLDM